MSDHDTLQELSNHLRRAHQCVEETTDPKVKRIERMVSHAKDMAILLEKLDDGDIGEEEFNSKWPWTEQPHTAQSQYQINDPSLVVANSTVHLNDNPLDPDEPDTSVTSEKAENTSRVKALQTAADMQQYVRRHLNT
jgi:hypothetical protein